jgi:hypothetical protein
LAVVVVLATALVCGLGGCGNGSPATDGPLSDGARGGDACAPSRSGQPQTFGIEVFTNHGHVTVVLDRVALRHPQHERVVGSYAVPGMWLVGVVPWPPRWGVPPTWKNRQPVHGFRVAPGRSFNMVLGVAATVTGLARSQGLAVYYHDPAGSYVATDDFGFLIDRGKASCLPP